MTVCWLGSVFIRNYYNFGNSDVREREQVRCSFAHSFCCVKTSLLPSVLRSFHWNGIWYGTTIPLLLFSIQTALPPHTITNVHNILLAIDSHEAASFHIYHCSNFALVGVSEAPSSPVLCDRTITGPRGATRCLPFRHTTVTWGRG